MRLRAWPAGYNGRSSGGLAIWSDLFELVVVLLAAWFVWRVITHALRRPSQPAEPDNYAGTPARLRPRPKLGAGAIAIAEPDEEDEEPSFHLPAR